MPTTTTTTTSNPTTSAPASAPASAPLAATPYDVAVREGTAAYHVGVSERLFGAVKYCKALGLRDTGAILAEDCGGSAKASERRANIRRMMSRKAS